MALPASDNFNRADETPLSNGGKWTVTTSAGWIQLISNQAYAGFASPYWYAISWTGDTFNADQYSKATLTGTSTNNLYGIGVRMSTSANTGYIFVKASSTTAEVRKIVSGSYTILGSAYSITISSGDVLKLSVAGQTLTPNYNSTDQATRSDPGGISSGYPGLYTAKGYNESTTWDDWSADNVSGGVSDLSINVADCVAPILQLGG